MKGNWISDSSLFSLIICSTCDESCACVRVCVRERTWSKNAEHVLGHVTTILPIMRSTCDESCVCVCEREREREKEATTGWWRLIGCLKMQVIFRKRATNCRALLRKMTYDDKASYDSTPPCIWECRICSELSQYGVATIRRLQKW